MRRGRAHELYLERRVERLEGELDRARRDLEMTALLCRETRVERDLYRTIIVEAPGLSRLARAWGVEP